MTLRQAETTAPTPEAMTRLGRALARHLGGGDLVTLTGDLGAGKSHLARAIIRAHLGEDDADVPSPTYTLVNVYDTPRVQIWHADLYRLGDADDLLELGLEDAIGDVLTLVEWPDRWPDLPARRLEIAITPDGDGRRLVLTGRGPNWDDVLDTAQGDAWIATH